MKMTTLKFKSLPSKVRKAEIESQLLAFRKRAGIPTQDDHFNGLELTVKDLRALHAKCIKTGRFPIARLELIDLICAVRNRHSNGTPSDTLSCNRHNYNHAKFTVKWLRGEWRRLEKLMNEFYPGKQHGPRRIGKPSKAA